MPYKEETPSSHLTGAKQTMAVWSRVIHSAKEAPLPFQEFLQNLESQTSAFPYAVFAPSLGRLLHKHPEKMICKTESGWIVAENGGNELTMKEYPLGNIRDIEMGRILLFSWITISGKTEDGAFESSTIEFNATSERYYLPFLRQFRSVPDEVEDAWLRVEEEKFKRLASDNFKFMNYARSSLKGSEKVIRFIWQPEIRQRTVGLRWWPFFQTLTLAHLIILTDKEVILIREDERSGLVKGERYGGAQRYIPLEEIDSISISEQDDDGMITLSLTMKKGDPIEWRFAARLRSELQQFQEDFLTT